jgi:Tol biopolymer transport system component
MKLFSLRQLLRPVLPAPRAGRRGVRPRRKGRPFLPAVERLEDRRVPSTLQAISLPSTGDSFSTAVSADGRFTVFTSTAAGLVPGEVNANAFQNVFVYDHQAGTVALVNHLPGQPNRTGNGGLGDFAGQQPVNSRPPDVMVPVISADGSTIAFVSYDTNLVRGESLPAGTRGPVRCLYLYDTQTRDVRLVSHETGAPTQIDPLQQPASPAISANGGRIAYVSQSGTSGGTALALYDPGHDSTTFTPAADTTRPLLSDDGHLVIYHRGLDIYLTNAVSGRTVLVSHAYNSPTAPGTLRPGPPIGPGGRPPVAGTPNALATATDMVLSGDGRYIAFVSAATNLVRGQDTGNLTNVFLYTVATGAVTLISGAGGSASVGGDGNSDSPSISDDGTYVAYRSDADNLVSGHIAGSNVYESNTRLGTQALVSHQAGAPAVAAGGAWVPVTDDDGHLVVYVSTAGDLVLGQTGLAGVGNVFVWLRQTGANALVSGHEGSATVTAKGDSDHPLLAGTAFPGFSSAASDLGGSTGGTSVAYINTMVALSLSPDVIPGGSGAGTVVGVLSVSSLLAGQYLPPVYSLPAGAASNSLFTLGAPANNQAPLLTQFASSSAQAYAVLVEVNAGYGEDLLSLPVFAAAPPIPGADPLLPELVAVRVGKHKTVRLMLEVFDLVTGAEVEALAIPFQGAAYRDISLVPLALNGAGIVDLVLVSARKGKHTATALLPV